MYIYKTTNLITNKIYIGKRVYRKKDDEWYIGSGILLKKSIKKYGRENFKKEILEWCTSLEEQNKLEIYWISYFNSTDLNIGYNLSSGGDGGNIGIKGYVKIANKLRGVKKSKEFCNNISKRFKGVPKSKEHVEKVRQALLGKKRPTEVVNKMSKSIKQKYDEGWESPVQKTVYQYNRQSGNFIEEYKSASEVKRILNIDRKAICNNCLGKTKSSGGFIWSYTKTNNINENNTSDCHS